MKQKKQNRLIRAILFTLIIQFIIIAFVILSPFEIIAIRTVFPIISAIVIAYFLLGIVLVILTLRSKIKGKKRIFLMLTGTSSSGFFVGVILHNFLYALGVITNSIPVLHHVFEFLHGLFFIAAVILCPLGFIVGVVGCLITFHDEKI